MGIVKNAWGHIDHGTLKSGVSHKLFDELRRLTERFFHVDSDGIIFGFTTNLLCVCADCQRKKMTPKIEFFLYFEIFCYWFLLETYLDKDGYCSEFDLTRQDLDTRFWIPTIKLFVIMTSFMITEKINISGFSNSSNNLKVILSSFLNSLNPELCWLYSFFLHWFLPYDSQSIYSWISKKHDQTSFLW